jgi:phosphohistidine phosphatase
VQCLYLLRHAKSSWDDPGLADVNRPLAPRGRKATQHLCAHLTQRGIEPALVVCSPSVRTLQTLDGIRPALGKSAKVEIDNDLYGAGPDELLRIVRRVPSAVASVLVIAHNPGLEMLATCLAASGDALPRLREKFPTGALATLRVAGAWSELRAGSAELVEFTVPRDLEA